MRSVLALLAVWVLHLNTLGVTVSFDTVTRYPESTLEIDGVSIEASRGALVGTLEGLGLGVQGVGSFASIDRTMYFPEGSFGPESDTSDAALTLRVNGKIDSVTILPYFNVLLGEPAKLTFAVSYWPHPENSTASLTYIDVDPSVPGPIVIDFDQEFLPLFVSNVAASSDDPQFLHFVAYREQNGNPEEEYEFGFSIQSLTYTPTNVPEPGSTDYLLAIALIFLGVAQKMMAGRSTLEVNR